jgi:hypothetical protein
MDKSKVYNEPQSLDAERRLCEFIGDLSEGVLSCSFNDDEVLQLALNGSLNEQIEHVCSYERERCMGTISRHAPADGNFGAEFIRQLTALRGWPEGWYAPFTPLDQLGLRYKDLFTGTPHEALLEPVKADKWYLAGYKAEFPAMPGSPLSNTSFQVDIEEPMLLRPDGNGNIAVRLTTDIDDTHLEVVVTRILNPGGSSSTIGKVTDVFGKELYPVMCTPVLTVTPQEA